MRRQVIRNAQLLILSLAWAPVFAQPAGTATTTTAAKDPFDAALRQPLLGSGEALDQMQTFLLSRAARLVLPDRPETWMADAERLRRRILDEVVLKGVPREWIDAKPRVEEVGRIETDKGYIIRKLRYEGYPGLWVPALLYEPTKIEGRVPAVLNPNGHVGAPGKAIDYKQIRCINMAKRGMLALNLEWVGMGELKDACYAHRRQAYLDLCGRSGVSVFYLLLKRGLDVLLSQPNADPDRVAVTGLSGGGWQTIFFSALDLRVKAAAPNAGYIAMDARARFVGDVGDIEQNPADLVRIADYSHLTAMLAPRPALLIYNRKDDCCFPSERAKTSVYDPVVPLYEKLGLRDAFQFHTNHDPGTHNYEKDNREALYRFLNRCFFPDGSRPDKEIPCDGEVRKQEELNCGIPEDNASFCTLAGDLAQDLPHDRCPAGDPAAVTDWQRQTRGRLREVVRLPARQVVTPWQVSGPTRCADLKVTGRRLRIGREWMLPAVEVTSATVAPVRTAIVVADDGRAGTAPTVRELIGEGCRVYVVDVALAGETVPAGFPVWQLAEMVSTVGERPLGVAAAQILAVARFVKNARPAESIAVVGIGCASSLIVLTAAALDDGAIDEVTAIETLPSLKLLIEDKIDYAPCPQLFCFGLLERFDVRELIAMCLPRKVRLIRPAGPADRIERELASLDDLADAIGAPRIDKGL